MLKGSRMVREGRCQGRGGGVEGCLREGGGMFSVVGETLPARLTRWQPKIFEKGWQDLAIHPNNAGEFWTFKCSRLTILHREIFRIIVSRDSTVLNASLNGIPIDESLICGFCIHPQHNSQGAMLLTIHS